MPAFDELDESLSNFAQALIKTNRMSHAAIVVNLAAVLEYDLERSIIKKLRPLNKKMTERLFEIYGPLSSFAAKIDMAFALDITTTEIHDELNKVRAIRNAFSHSKRILSLDTEPIRSLFYKLKRPPNITGTFVQQFVKYCLALDDFLEAFLVRMGETEDLRLLKKSRLNPHRAPDGNSSRTFSITEVITMRRILLEIIFSTSFIVSASADITGNELLELCTDTDKVTNAACGAWMGGFIAGMSSAETIARAKNIPAATCIPDKATGNQFRLIVEKYLRENPQSLHLDAAVLATLALIRAFPCQK